MKLRGLKPKKLDWRGKVLKLQQIVLSGPAIEDLPPNLAKILELWRARHHGKITEEEYLASQANIDLSMPAEHLIWEPYSDERGEPESLYGWHIEATMYGVSDRPYWLVRANRENTSEPTEQQLKILDKAIEILGCHDTELDQICEFPDADGRLTMWWSWFHTGPLLEIHIHPKTTDMRVVTAGAPLREGYQRMARISRKDPDAQYQEDQEL